MVDGAHQTPRLAEHALLGHRASEIRKEGGDDHPGKKKQTAEIGSDRLERNGPKRERLKVLALLRRVQRHRTDQIP